MPDAAPPLRVIGVGAPLRGDDGVGREIVRRLHGRVPPGVELHESDGEPAGLVALLEGAGAAILADACRSGAAPGAIRRLDLSAGPLPLGTGLLSTHGMGLAEAVEIARALGGLPRGCVVYAVEAQGFDPGAPLAPATARAAAKAAGMILVEIAALRV